MSRCPWVTAGHLSTSALVLIGGRHRPSPTWRCCVRSCGSTRSESDQTVDLVDQPVDLPPVTPPALVVVARMLHVHRSNREHAVAGNELVELLSCMIPCYRTSVRHARGVRARPSAVRGSSEPRADVASLGLGGLWGERRRAIGRDPADQGEARDGSESSGSVCGASLECSSRTGPVAVP